MYTQHMLRQCSQCNMSKRCLRSLLHEASSGGWGLLAAQRSLLSRLYQDCTKIVKFTGITRIETDQCIPLARFQTMEKSSRAWRKGVQSQDCNILKYRNTTKYHESSLLFFFFSLESRSVAQVQLVHCCWKH